MRHQARLQPAILFCLSLALAPSIGAQESIRVGSFYISNLGGNPETEYRRSLAGLVEIIRLADPDVMVIPGVKDTDLGRAQAGRLVEMLNIAAVAVDDRPSTYQLVLPDRPIGNEAAGFIWRSPIQLISPPEPITTDNDPDGNGKPTFFQVPQRARFSAAGREFDLLSIHLRHDPRPDSRYEGRAAEYDALVAWLKSYDGPGAVLGGNFNRFILRMRFDRLAIPGHEQWYRFPFLEGIKGDHPGFDIVRDPAPTAEYTTVTNRIRRRLWDGFVVTRGLYDTLPEQPQWDTDVGLIPYDEFPHNRWITKNWADSVQILSDHRPVWLRLQLAP